MRVTMSMVLDILREQFVASKGSYYKPAVQVSIAHMGIPANDRLVRDCVIVVDRTMVDELPEACSSRIVAVFSPGEALPQGYAIGVSTVESASTIANAIEKGICRYKRVLDKMSDLSLRGGHVAQIANCAHDLLQNPILIHDAALRVVARTENDSMNDEMWTPLESTVPTYRERVMPEGFLEFMSLLRRFGEVKNYRMPNGVLVNSYRTKEIGGAFLVVSLVQKNRVVTEGDRAILKFLCMLAEMNMKTHTKLVKEELGYNGLLLDALKGNVTNYVEFANRMAALGYELKPFANVMIVSPLKGEFNDRQAQRTIEEIVNTFSFGRGVCYKGALVFYETYDNLGVITPTDYDRFAFFLNRFRMVAALGNPQPVEKMVEELYLSASFNMRVGRKMYRDRNLLFLEDCQPYWVYETCLQHGSADLYIHPALNILRDHDLRTGGSHYTLLKKLAMNRGNKSITAEDLYIQRNTLQSRLREIEVICRIDLSNPATLDHIRRSFVLEGYCEGSLRIEGDGGAS